MAGVSGMQCCGWSEIYELAAHTRMLQLDLEKGTDDVLSDIFTCSEFYDEYEMGTPQAFMQGAVVFTANYAEPNYASLFAAGLKKLKIGRVVRIPTFGNPNHDTTISTFCWLINKKAAERYAKKKGWIKKEKQDNSYGSWY